MGKETSTQAQTVRPGQEVFLVTRKGEILEGFRVKDVLFDLVSLDRAPLESSDKQGFTFKAGQLKPNWCAGRRALIAGLFSREEAEQLLARRSSHQGRS